MEIIKKIIRLSFTNKKMFIEACLTLAMMRVAIMTISFKRLVRSLEHQQNQDEMPLLSDREMKTAIAVGHTITRTAAHTPWESACLVQSLTAQRMLQRRGIPGVFYLGVMKDKENKEQLKTHAWSQCGEKIITGAGGYENFTVLSVFCWNN